MAEIAGGAVVVTTPATPLRAPQIWAAKLIKTSSWLIGSQELYCKGIHLMTAPIVSKVTHSNIEYLRLFSKSQHIGTTRAKYVMGPQFVSNEIVLSFHVGKTHFAVSAIGDQDDQMVAVTKLKEKYNFSEKFVLCQSY